MKLAYTITADVQQAEAANARVEQGLERVAARAKYTGDREKDLEAARARAAKDADARIKALESTWREQDRTREQQWRNEDKRLRDQGKQTGQLENDIKALGRSMMAAFAVNFTVGFVRDLGRAAGEIKDTSAALGISTRSFQGFKFAVEDSGGTVNDLTSSIATMSKNLAGGNSSASAALQALNLDVGALKRMQPDAAFLAIADAIRGNKDPMQQMQQALAIFGETGRKVLPAVKADIRALSDEAKALGLVMDQDALDALDQFEKRWKRAELAVKGVISSMLAAIFQLNDAIANGTPSWLSDAVRRTVDSTPVGALAGVWEHGVGGVVDRAWNRALLGGETNGPSVPTAPGSPTALMPAYQNASIDDLLKIEVAAPAIQRVARATKEQGQATAETNAEVERYLRNMTQVIGVNQDAYARGVNPMIGGIAGAIQPTPWGTWGDITIPSTNPLNMAWYPDLYSGAIQSGMPQPGQQPGAPGRDPRVTWYGGMPQFGNWNGRAGDVAGAAFGGMQLVNGIGNFRSATDVAGRGNRAWAGAQQGAQIGAMFGPYGAIAGMAIGAIVGALRKPGFEQEMKRVAQNFGVNISEELARAIDKQKDLFRGDRVASEIFSLGAIIGEAGGITDQNVTRLTARLRDVFVMVETGKFSTEQARKVLDDAFPHFAEHLRQSGELASKQFIEILALNDRFGTESAEMAAWVGEQSQTALDGLQAYLANATVSSQEAATGITAAIAGLFGELRQQGMSTAEILAQLAPMIETLAAQLKEAGLEGTTAFQYLGDLAAYAGQEIVQRATAAVDGLTQALRGMHNGGLLNQETFQGLARAVYDVYENLYLQGQGGEQAWRMIQPGLQTIWELQQKFGYAVDEATQGLLDEALAAGLIGEAFKPAGELMVGLMSDVRDILGDIRDHFLGLGQAAQQAADQARQAWGDFPEPGNGGSGGGGDYYAMTGGVVPQYLARGGVAGLFQPRYTDTVPAMLTPGEGVLSRRGMQALGRLNAGAGGGGSATVNVNLAGAVISDPRTARLLAETVRREFERELSRTRQFSVVN